MTDAEVLTQVDEAFLAAPRREHFTNDTHCCECFEHDELLRARDREALGFDDLAPLVSAMDARCVLHSERASHSDDERHSANPS